MKAFKYGKNDAPPNKPLVVSANTLQNKNNNAGSAAQKLCLFRLLSLMPEDCEVWELYLTCREVVDICLALVIRKSLLPYLQQEVGDLNQLVSQYSPDNFPCK